jgi:hypothetical protein
MALFLIAFAAVIIYHACRDKSRKRRADPGCCYYDIPTADDDDGGDGGDGGGGD